MPQNCCTPVSYCNPSNVPRPGMEVQQVELGLWNDIFFSIYPMKSFRIRRPECNISLQLIPDAMSCRVIVQDHSHPAPIRQSDPLSRTAQALIHTCLLSPHFYFPRSVANGLRARIHFNQACRPAHIKAAGHARPVDGAAITPVRRVGTASSAASPARAMRFGCDGARGLPRAVILWALISPLRRVCRRGKRVDREI